MGKPHDPDSEDISNDAYPEQAIEMKAEFRCLYAKAWLLRGCIRGDMYLVKNGVSEHVVLNTHELPVFDTDFKTSKELDAYDVNLYVNWARAYWRIGAFEDAIRIQEEGLKEFGTFKEQKAAGSTELSVTERTVRDIDVASKFLEEEVKLVNTQWDAKKRKPQGGCCLM